MNQDKLKKIDDEQLSAFLDAELSEADMEMVREQLMEDENLVNRLAELAMVDELVAKSYKAIDTRLVPESITDLLAESEPKDAEIIPFPLVKKVQQHMQKYVAIAASVALVIGFGLSQTLHREPSDWSSIAQILEHTASGVALASSTGTEIKPRITFINKDGDYCRQFSMLDEKAASENIACRKDNQWKLSETVTLAKTQQTGTYQTASGGSVLDEKIEQIANSEFFDAQAESAAIAQHWVKNK